MLAPIHQLKAIHRRPTANRASHGSHYQSLTCTFVSPPRNFGRCFELTRKTLSSSQTSCPTGTKKTVAQPLRRQGLTLLEVILSLAIFVGSIAAISKLIEVGTRSAQYNQLLTRAVVLAESKIGEIVIGLVPLDTAGGSDSFSEDPAWEWQLDSFEGPVAGLNIVSVTVTPSASGELANSLETVSYTLSRWMRDPNYTTTLEESEAESLGETP